MSKKEEEHLYSWLTDQNPAGPDDELLPKEVIREIKPDKDGFIYDKNGNKYDPEGNAWNSDGQIRRVVR